MMLNLFYAFCSGAFGAMMGASGAFVMTGCMCVVGMAALFGGAGGDFIHNCLTFGPMMLPAVTFEGGAAAAHYARWRGYVPYGQGKNIEPALINLHKPDVLLFGGFIGMIGYAISTGLGLLGLGDALDTSATAIMLIALTLKLVFDHDPLGKPEGSISRYSRKAPAWQDTMTQPVDMVLHGLLIGGMASCCVSEVLASENPLVAQYGIFLPFGFSSIVLLLNLGSTRAPTTHHITLCAAYAMAAGGSIAWGIIAAILAVIASDFLGRTFHLYGDGFVCPAAMSIVFVAPLVRWLLPLTGIYTLPDVIPVILIAAGLAAACCWQRHANRSHASSASA